MWVRLKIRARMLAGFGVAFALLGVLLFWAVAHLVSLGRATDAILRENYRSIQAAVEMFEALEEQDVALFAFMMGEREHTAETFRRQEIRMLQWLGKAKDNITVEGEGNILEAIESGYERFLNEAHKLLAMSGADDAELREFFEANVTAAFEATAESCMQLRVVNESVMFEASKRAEHVAHRAIWSTVVVGVAALILGMGFSLVFSKRLVEPVVALTRAMGQVTEGNYEARVTAHSPDELGILSEGFNAMAQKLGAYHNLNIERLVMEKRRTDAVLKSISDGIVLLDSELRVAGINPAAASLFRVEQEEAMGRHLLELVRNERLFQHVKSLFEAGLPPRLEDEERVLTVSTGDAARHYLYDARRIEGGEHAAKGVVLVLRDVTRFRELDRMKNDFVMAASHELRTPLTGIEMSLGLLDEMAGSLGSENAVVLLRAAIEDAARLKALVNDLLDLSRIESGHIEMQFVHTPVRMLFEKTVLKFELAAREKEVEMRTRVPEDLPQVWADPNKVLLVLSNLVANALRYVPEKGHITLSAELTGAWVQLSVADDGCGIPEEYQARVFDKFIQVAGDATPGGSGLGLAICKEVVRAHRGVLWVESAPGKGSTFSCTLPVYTAPAGEEA